MSGWRAPGAARRQTNLARLPAGGGDQSAGGGDLPEGRKTPVKTRNGALVNSGLSAVPRATSAAPPAGKSGQGPERARGPASEILRPKRLGLAELRAVIPRHVERCWNNGCRSDYLYTFDKRAPAKKTRVRFRCGSWRCHGNGGECARFSRHQLYARVLEAIKRDKLKPRGFVFMVLTVDQKGWESAEDAFKDISRMHREFFAKLRTWMKRQGMRPIGREWMATVEVHRNGFPHLNILVWSPELAAYIEREQAREAERLAEQNKEYDIPKTLFPPEILALARRAHWNVRCTAERARNYRQVVNYAAGVAGDAGRVISEIAKLTQLPMNAPQRFRRVRTGKSWLPPKRRDPNRTGGIFRRWVDERGERRVSPIVSTKKPELVAHVGACAEVELALWEREQENAPALRMRLAELGRQVNPHHDDDAKAQEFEKAKRQEMSRAWEELATPHLFSVIVEPSTEYVAYCAEQFALWEAAEARKKAQALARAGPAP